MKILVIVVILMILVMAVLVIMIFRLSSGCISYQEKVITINKIILIANKQILRQENKLQQSFNNFHK